MNPLWTTVTVEAENEEAAVEKALDENQAGGICAQCSGWNRGFSVDEDGWDVPPSELKENPVRLIEVESN